MDSMIGRRRQRRTGQPVERATFQLLAAAVAAAAAAAAVAPRLAMLPLAVVFGWTQIGGV